MTAPTVVRLPDHPFPTTWATATKVALCAHDWVSIYVETTPGRFEEMDRCEHCHAPRCLTRHEWKECTLIRHHTTVHMFQDGSYEALGGAS